MGMIQVRILRITQGQDLLLIRFRQLNLFRFRIPVNEGCKERGCFLEVSRVIGFSTLALLQWLHWCFLMVLVCSEAKDIVVDTHSSSIGSNACLRFRLSMVMYMVRNTDTPPSFMS